ncbi:LLM class flavin-dependent oxidoreductase [Rhizobium puerariae]|uniref:LLM class flavin-dependent oxidoreductase n=1 Tax=Rhizobium puerariae TaxID=1585791 RepID=A0ABV6AHP4_9HYPH
MTSNQVGAAPGDAGPDGRMRLSLAIRGVGYHPAAWRLPGTDPAAEQRLQHYAEVARIAERGKFDMIFFADTVAIRESALEPDTLARNSTLARIEPLMILAGVASQTSRIGLAATASTTYNTPYQIARHFGSLDLISNGRACWNLVTSWSDAEARNFGLDVNASYGDRYDRAREFVGVVTRLWNSWEDDAFLFDKQGGLFHDPAKLHTLDHEGRYYKVKGPLNVPPSPQGRPVICEAGASEAGQELAAYSADVVYAIAQTEEAAGRFYRSVKARLPKYGRSASDVKIMPGISPIVGKTEAEARAKFRALQDLIDPRLGLSLIAPYVGDLSGYPVDSPIPDVAMQGSTLETMRKLMKEIAAGRELTIRALYEHVAAGRGHWTLVGSAEYIADQLEAWFRAGVADGFNIVAAHLPGVIEDFVELVVPILQERGLFRRDYEGETLRENLGLRKPVGLVAG